MSMHLNFFGAVGTVTGSKYLLEAGDRRILVDCGLFQGFKQLRLRNWARMPFDPARVDAMLLTHAHLDHSGAIPLLVRDGYRGPIYATPGTCELCTILLADSGHLQERDAEFANRHGFSRHHPAKPLYTEEDAKTSLERFAPVEFDSDLDLGHGLRARFLPAGHILGAAMIRFSFGGTTMVFSGDLGRLNAATMVDPTVVRHADYLVVESTYGDRLHDRTDPEDRLADIVNRTAARGGVVLIPAFAVGRTQTVLYHLERLKAAGRIPNLPVYLDSPMAIDASDIFCEFAGEHRLTAQQARAACGVAQYVRAVEDSKALDAAGAMPMVIISASGMATGGRILHHLERFAPDKRNTIVFTGFQAGGTRGASMVGGAEAVKIHGRYVPIQAEVDSLDMFSAHADADEIMGWLRGFEAPPKRTFITHGEPAAADALRHRIEEELGWACAIPEYRDRVALK